LFASTVEEGKLERLLTEAHGSRDAIVRDVSLDKLGEVNRGRSIFRGESWGDWKTTVWQDPGEEERELLRVRGEVMNWLKNGKHRGNIRLLLGTLHAILWNGTGWKPVQIYELEAAENVESYYHKSALMLRELPVGASNSQKLLAASIFRSL